MYSNISIFFNSLKKNPKNLGIIFGFFLTNLFFCSFSVPRMQIRSRVHLQSTWTPLNCGRQLFIPEKSWKLLAMHSMQQTQVQMSFDSEDRPAATSHRAP